MSLKVYTASAGSGKTHALTREFLRLMLSSDDPRHFTTIQAVTFTKKATAEMKGRIVAELSTLVHRPQESLFTDELCKLLSISEHRLKARAEATLHSLLLDYSNFRVRTIDSFFQEVVRSFAYELGRSGALRVQIDSDQILRQAVLEVLARQDHEGSDKDIEAWLREMTTDSIEEGRSYSIDGELCKFAKQLEGEAVKQLRAGKIFPTRAEVKELRTAAQKVITTCQQELLARADKALQALEATQIPIEKLSNGTGGVFGAIFAYKKTPTHFFDKESGALGQRKRLCAFLDATDDEEQLDKLVGKDKSKRPIREQIHPHLSSIRSTLLAFRDYNLQKLPLHATALQICQYAGLYGILIDIDDALQELKREGRLMLISDAPSLIQALIKENEAPFLYEKIGTRIEHHMIDEFQDTSRMQYDNFKPLLCNAQSQGKDCLIVGDAKQSIYRFRNSDSTLLTSQISKDFKQYEEQIKLSDNWRSVPEIVDFNNALYPLLRAQIRSHFDELWSKVAGFGFPEGQEQVKEELDDELSKLLKAYDDVQQSTPKPKEQRGLGQVVLHRYQPNAKENSVEDSSAVEEADTTAESNEQVEKEALPQLPAVLVNLLKRGYRCSDIAILTRTKNTAAAIAKVLLNATEDDTEGYSLPFISEEALHVDRAYSVRFIIAALSYLADTNITLRLAVLQEAYQQLLSLSQLNRGYLTEDELQFLRDSGRQGLYEVVEIINARFGHLFPTSEGAYLVKLLDMLYGWEQEETADIANFLQYWQDKGSKQSISNATAEDAITLMTIHKSKGLGFPVVLLPDITWALDENEGGHKENILWCPIPDNTEEVKSLRVAGVTKVPLKYTSALQISYFAKTYFEEKLKNIMDSLNLLYVATTRPKQELHIWIKEEKPVEKQEEEKEEGKDKGKKKGKQPQKKEKTISSIEDLFLATTETGKVLCDTLPAIQTTKEEPIGESASAPRNITKDTEEEGTMPLTVEGLYSYPIDKRLAILREGLKHFSEDSQRAYGRTLHLILSEIKTASDVETAIREAEHQGYIKAKDLEGLRLRLNAVMKHPQTAHWFDGTGEVFNERAIIGGQLKTSRRPDRVVFYPDDGHIEVIDYKSGEEHTAHHRQVREYMSLLRQMGYTKITGYLCYFRDEGPLLRSVTA